MRYMNKWSVHKHGLVTIVYLLKLSDEVSNLLSKLQPGPQPSTLVDVSIPVTGCQQVAWMTCQVEAELSNAETKNPLPAQTVLSSTGNTLHSPPLPSTPPPPPPPPPLQPPHNLRNSCESSTSSSSSTTSQSFTQWRFSLPTTPSTTTTTTPPPQQPPPTPPPLLLPNNLEELFHLSEQYKYLFHNVLFICSILLGEGRKEKHAATQVY
ncbi:hypothetical protein Ahy_A06g030440 isoform A [Arachis hypogaea]|uniref:Uncharacterized protein n=1 Tax=Arachis hypogaea TaxID=3818 RepID=A0A445CW98_ARAHY|nr:hypothetical protein Ahy_A06g030440 isoform A [Arachis hypogaea]